MRLWSWVWQTRMSTQFSYGNELLNLPGLPYHPLWTGDSNSYCVEWFWIFNKVIYEANTSSCGMISYIYSHNCVLCIYTDVCLNCHLNMTGPLLSDWEGHRHLQVYLPPRVTSLERERQSVSRRTRVQAWWCTHTHEHTDVHTHVPTHTWTCKYGPKKSEALNFDTKINKEM